MPDLKPCPKCKGKPEPRRVGDMKQSFGEQKEPGTAVLERKISMRLIDADWLSEAIHDNVPAPYEDASWAKENCLAEIDAAPTVDAVPVVRCLECKYRSKDGCPIIDANIWMDDDDFCSHGERKEGAE